jgi:hypothetical protein
VLLVLHKQLFDYRTLSAFDRAFNLGMESRKIKGRERVDVGKRGELSKCADVKELIPLIEEFSQECKRTRL